MPFEFVSLQTIQNIAEQYGYWTVLLGIMLENAGIPLPGETIVVVASFLAGSGKISYWWVLGCAITGAILGDTFGYWIGFYGGWPLLLRLGRAFKISDDTLIDIRNRFSHNVSRAVFLGRFVALLRIFAGPMAGIAKMPYPQFLLANIAGAFLWAGVTVTVAFFAGRVVPLEQVIALMGQFGLVVVLAIVLFFGLPPLLEYVKHRRSILKDQES